MTRKIYLYSISVHTLLNKLRINVATVSRILPASSSRVVANGGILVVPPKEKKNKRE
jgi:hypothetical protein